MILLFVAGENSNRSAPTLTEIHNRGVELSVAVIAEMYTVSVIDKRLAIANGR